METQSKRVKTLSTVDAVAIITGIVIGAGIFKTPSIVAANAGSESAVIGVWLAGGVISIIGALCYTELAAAYPHAGGDYHYLNRALGQTPAFLFAWARMTVIQTGSIAMLAFIVGDYASEIFSLGRWSSALYAMITVSLLTVVNIAGIRQGSLTQNFFTVSIVAGLFGLIIIGLAVAQPAQASPPVESGLSRGALGKAMIFVLLTYGGWNEAAYLSSELRDSKRAMIRVLLYSIGIITLIYVLLNLALLKGLGLESMSRSDAPAADFIRLIFGSHGVAAISLLVVLASLSTINGSMITGARTNYALGRDFRVLGVLGKWNANAATPVNALIIQGLIALALVGIGIFARSGFVMMVEYTAPVFWFFFLMVGVSLIILRIREPHVARPFKVPFYPATPLIFCGFCLYMLQSSLAYTGIGAMIGFGVLAAGIPVLILNRRKTEKRLPDDHP